MRTSINEVTINDFKTRFEAFHDAILLAINYDLDARDGDNNYLHRVSVKINTPDWKIKPVRHPLQRIELLFEFEAVEYILLRKPQDRLINRISDIDLQLNDNKVIADFLPFYESDPMRGNKNIHKYYEDNIVTLTNSLFVVIAGKCYWSILPNSDLSVKVET